MTKELVKASRSAYEKDPNSRVQIFLDNNIVFNMGLQAETILFDDTNEIITCIRTNTLHTQNYCPYEVIVSDYSTIQSFRVYTEIKGIGKMCDALGRTTEKEAIVKYAKNMVNPNVYDTMNHMPDEIAGAGLYFASDEDKKKYLEGNK